MGLLDNFRQSFKAESEDCAKNSINFGVVVLLLSRRRYRKSFQSSITRLTLGLAAMTCAVGTYGVEANLGNRCSLNGKQFTITSLSINGSSKSRLDSRVGGLRWYSEFQNQALFSFVDGLSYGFDEDISAAKISDTRTLSGRVVLLPQAKSSLSTLIQQIIDNTNPNDLASQYKLSPAEQSNLLKNVSKLDFVSSPLTGLTSGLLTTLTGGMHVTPTVRLPNASPLVIQSAADASSPFGIEAHDLGLIGTESSPVPFGSSVSLHGTYGPMKLATHGRKCPKIPQPKFW